VQHAHQKGVVHRDLKPSNVLVTLQEGKPIPKIIDFGVAKAINQRLTERTLFTEMGVLIGTPEYMSPEQADLSGLDVDTTTDVYSLGVVLYELLVGALPFDPMALRKAGYAEIQRIIREDDPPRPTTRLSSMGEKAREVARRRRSDVRMLTRRLRGDLEWITMKALEKDRTRRYPSASEFAADIGRHLANEPVTAAQPTLAYRLQKFVRRHRGKATAVAALLITLLAGLGTSTVFYFRSERQRALTEWEVYKAGLAAARSDIDNTRSEEARVRLRRLPKRLRAWEWNYLYWLSDRSIATLNTGDPYGDYGTGRSPQIAFSRDGSHLLVSGMNAVHVWELPSLHHSGDYGPFHPILAMSDDGSRLACRATGSRPNAIEITDVLTGKVLTLLGGHTSQITNATFSRDGFRLAARSDDNEIRLWDTGTGQTLTAIHRQLPTKKRHLHDVIALSPDGRRLAASSSEALLL
jgi:hypothetical protein